jgi:hypothetical protein
MRTPRVLSPDRRLDDIAALFAPLRATISPRVAPRRTARMSKSGERRGVAAAPALPAGSGTSRCATTTSRRGGDAVPVG